jgi:hypothetical protein
MSGRVWVTDLTRTLAIVAAISVTQPSVAQPSSPPLPPPRPDRPAPSEALPDKPADPVSKEEEKSSQIGDPAAACIERLTTLGLRFEKLPPVQDNACSIGNPVMISGLPDGVEVAPGSLMECSLAEELARWVSEVVVPRTKEHLKAAPKKILIGTSYQCRDQRSGSKLSEHAFGNGIDVMGFEFDTRAPLTIGSHAEGSLEATFQSTIQKEACPIFTTVLGPGSDADHGDHLHLDMRGRKGGYRICQ